MSYRVDIPTLSANEVYTLTFEYEGAETIQLIVGDLTLETTDRRVVFTTTSPVNHIESNVNLTNLNIYEGYYESDDFGGEYTQESYIEGKSLVNYHDFNRCNLTLNNGTQGKWEFLDDGFARMTTLDVNYNHCRPKPTNYTSEATYTVATWVRNFNSEAGNVMFECFHYLDIIKTIKLDGSIITGIDSGTHHYSTGQEGLMISVGKYTGISSKITNGTYHQFMGNFGTSGGFVSGDNVEIFVMVLEGDKADDILNGLIQPFHGIGCVKSPKIISREQPLNMFYCTNWTSTLNNGTVTCQDGKFYFDGSFGGYTWFDIINGGKAKNNIYLEPGSYFAKMKAHSKEPCVGSGTCVSLEATMENGITLDLCSVYTHKDKIYNQVTAQNKQFTSPIVKLTLKIWYGGNGSNDIIIDGIYISKTNIGDDLAFKENHVVSTPDDLELYCNHYYDRNAKKSSPCNQDTLDLTTGTITRKNIKARLNESIAKYGTVEGALVTVNGGDMVRVKYEHTNSSMNIFPVQIEGEVIGTSATGIVFNASQGGDGKWFPTGDIEHAYTTTNTLFMFFNPSRFDGIDYTNLTTIKNWLIEQDFTLIIKIHNTSVYTEQLPTSINPLKSYHNGSIQTSSQQLTPTLKTTLPVSNKFTTTNLTSGSTYNIYFDGTATKLDAGGTIITDPVSPCEVECGGTTLTIEGTDIQNVRVIETTVKNEVGSVCGTTDVELSKIKTANSPSDSLISTKIEYWEQTAEYGNALRYVLPIQVKPNTKYILNTTNIQRLLAIWDVNKNELVLQNIYANSPYIWTTPADCPSEVYLYLVYQTDVNRAHLDELRMFEGEIDFGYQGQQEPLISQTISKLEQPIKLRSLGTTYDSYNPVTGELTKRIGVSETDGSYSVLSSPIVENVPMGERIVNIVNKTPINNTASNVTFEGNAIKVSGGYGIFSLPEMKPLTTYTIFVEYITNGRFIIVEGTGINGYPVGNNGNQNAGTKLAFNLTTRSATEHILALYAGTTLQIMIVEGTYSSYDDLPYFEGVAYKQVPPRLYTNGQVKVYSESDVYPTTILNGQSTNNYEINELNKSNNYTIRYDGECESINLAKKSNIQGTNRIVKAGATSGNLTFVNDSGDIDNVLLVQNDVREQEINHFNGLETVEVSKIKIFNTLYDEEFATEKKWVRGDNGQFEKGQTYVMNRQLNVDNYNKIYVKYSKTVNGGKPGYYPQVRVGSYKKDGTFINRQLINSERFTTYDNSLSFPQDTYYIILSIEYDREGGMYFEDLLISFHEIVGDTPRIETIDLPQPVQLNSLLDGTHDTYNPITGEYVQNVGYFVLDDTFASRWLIVKTKDGKPFAQRDLSTHEPNYSTLVKDYSFPDKLYDYQTGTKAIANIPLAYGIDHTSLNVVTPSLYGDTYFGNHFIKIALPFTPNDLDQWNYSYTRVNDWLRENPIHIAYKRAEPTITQLTPVNIPTFEGGILQLITTDGTVFPMVEYSMPTNNRYDTSSWETGAVYTQRNMTEAYFNESTTPMIPTETMTLTTDHISSGSIILNDNGNGLIVLKGNYTGRDIPYFTGMRSVEAIEVETTPSPDQPLFGKGGRK